MTDRNPENTHIVVFDGACNLCNASVNFIIARDPGHRFRFASQQREVGRKILAERGLDPDDPATFVLIKNGRCYMRSAAALEIARDFRGAWRVLRILKIIPAPLRDRLYDWLARNRYRLFGRRDTCLLPTRELADRFL